MKSFITFKSLLIAFLLAIILMAGTQKMYSQNPPPVIMAKQNKL